MMTSQLEHGRSNIDQRYDVVDVTRLDTWTNNDHGDLHLIGMQASTVVKPLKIRPEPLTVIREKERIGGPICKCLVEDGQ